jgi:hypothetical protein
VTVSDAATPPRGDDEPAVRAAGKLGEALETIERARGALYDFHQLIGEADFELGDAVDLLTAAGRDDLASRLATDIVGRNVLPGRWTFQVVEEFDDGYWTVVRDFERQARDELVGGRRHSFEARLKDRRRSPGRPGHEAGPVSGG